MKFFIDTEFSERGRRYPIELISLGAETETGATFYAVSNEFDADGCNDWVKEHVLPHIYKHVPIIGTCDQIAAEFLKWTTLQQDSAGPEFWAYYGDYDWVVLCQLYGRMIDLPEGWPKYCHDLKQMCDTMGNPRLPKQTTDEHHALMDAMWNRIAHDHLITLEASRRG